MKTLDYLQIKLLIKLHNYLYRRISGLSKKLNNSVHPKHRIMNFHQYFLDNIESDTKVLDIGCKYGEVTYDIANKASLVVACDIDEKSLAIAKKKFNKNNIRYIYADATTYDFKENFDYAILSNVLEHIEDRVKFLNKIKTKAKILLIRVPLIDRSWLAIYKKELGIEYRLDKSHYVEYTLESFRKEIESVGLKILTYSVQFGEIWAKISIK